MGGVGGGGGGGALLGPNWTNLDDSVLLASRYLERIFVYLALFLDPCLMFLDDDIYHVNILRILSFVSLDL